MRSPRLLQAVKGRGDLAFGNGQPSLGTRRIAAEVRRLRELERRSFAPIRAVEDVRLAVREVFEHRASLLETAELRRDERREDASFALADQAVSLA